MKNKIIIFLAGALVAVASWLVGQSTQVKTQPLGSVSASSEYHATTTSTGRFTAQTSITTTGGALGSVIITGAATGVINLYDATTTNVALRTGQKATSTILVATFPASTAAGTYTFDEILYDGLFIDIIGTMPTTTITYR